MKKFLKGIKHIVSPMFCSQQFLDMYMDHLQKKQTLMKYLNYENSSNVPMLCRYRAISFQRPILNRTYFV